ncbi:MAG: glycosyltransferase family 39 protein [Microthrixaceae bacterium]
MSTMSPPAPMPEPPPSSLVGRPPLGGTPPGGPPAEPERGAAAEPAESVEAAVAERDTEGAARRPMDPWERPAVALLLAVTAGLYLWGLSAGGWANSFYSAAAQAGSTSWKAWFFGASDAANSITVDKPPASLWVMGLSVRAFGLNPWSLLVPQALMGVGTVALVWAAVRRWFSAGAALLAGAVLATTPVAALMFRFNNPDALLTLLMVAAAVCTLRGVEDGRRRWAVATGVLLGFAFLTKQLQMMLVVPVLGGVWLFAGPRRLGRRIADLLAALGSMVVAAGWWMAIVTLWPADSRPYIGGSQNNSILELTLGYNGFGRLTGDEAGSVGGGGPGGAGGAATSRWGQTGWSRMFDGVSGGQIAWLIPAAAIGLVVGLWLTRRAGRSDVRRAALLVWGGWLVVTVLTFSFMAGIYHDYYTVVLAPAVAALVGMGADLLWRARQHLAARLVLALAVAGTSWWATVLLGRASDWNPWLAPLIAVVGFGSAALIAGASVVPRQAVVAGGVLAAVAVLAGPTAWAVETVAYPEAGSIVTAGPTVQGALGGPGGGGGPGGLPGGPPGQGGTGAQVPGNQIPGNQVPGSQTPGNQAPQGLPPGDAGRPAGGPRAGGSVPGGVGGPSPTGRQGGLPGGATQGAPGGAGGPGGLLESAEVSDEVAALLSENADEYRWVAAGVGSNRAAGFQLATERPVMPVGGFNGSDPSPTLEQFQGYVADGDIHWFIGGGSLGNQDGGSSESAEIADWVAATFPATTVDDVTLYDLAAD